MDAATAIRHFGGIATRAQLESLGLSGFNLTAAVRLGEIRRVRRAHYSTSTALPDAIQAVRIGGRLAGLSAARTFGLWTGFDTRLHVALPANASRLRTNLPPSVTDHVTPDFSPRESVLHWVQPSDPGPVCWRVSIEDCVRQVADWADSETAIACLDTARTVLGWDDSQLAGVFRETSALQRTRAAGSRPGSDAGTESVVRQRLLRCGVRVHQQVQISEVGRVDMVVDGARVVIEIDGKSHHSSAEAFENDRRRDAELAARGYVVVRLSFAKVFGDWAWCERMILSAITQFRNIRDG
jgi:very-short-patch-repair endonuclease